MGQKVNPVGFRLLNNKNWESIWFDKKNYAKNLINDVTIRSFIKKVDDAIKAGDEAKARLAFKALEPELMRGVTKNIIKLGTASRKLSRISATIKKIKK